MKTLEVVLVRRENSRRWHLLDRHGKTFCGAIATDPVPDDARGHVCPKCRRDFRNAAAIVNYLTSAPTEGARS